MKEKRILAAVVLAVCGCSTRKAAQAPENEAKTETNFVTLELAALKRSAIEVNPVRMTRLTEYLQVTGTVQPAGGRVSQVRSPANGRLLEVLVRVGDRVRAGQELARLDNRDAAELAAQLAAAKAELERLRVLLASQSRQAERNRRLSEIGAAPAKDYEQSRTEKEALEGSIRAQESAIAGIAARLDRAGKPISAPLAGIVIKAGAGPGELVDPGTELFTVADLSHVWVQAEVYEKDLGKVEIGQPASIRVDTYPDESFSGRVTYVSDALDPQTRTARVRCEAPNPSSRLKLDMFATVQLPTRHSRQALAVPVGAIQQLDGKNVVFVRQSPTRFEAREIKTGAVVSGRMEILSGLREGEMVVTMGAFHLKSILAGKELGEE